MEKLKPCPFCGGEARIITHRFYELSNTYGVTCKKCGSETMQFYCAEEDAVNAWNRREKDERDHTV